MPTSATLRTAICEQPPLGQAALLELSPLELRQIMHALTLQDARRILDSLAEHASLGGEFDGFQAVWSAWPALPEEDRQGYRLPADDWRSALHLYLEASRRTEQVGGVPLRTATLAILRLARCLATPARIVGFPAPDRPPPPTAGPATLYGDAGSPGQWLLALLSRSDRAGLYSAVGPADAEILAPLLRCPPAWVQEVGQTLLSRQGEPMGVTAATPERRYTAFGGIFLLLPLLDELPLAEATYGWPDLEEIGAIALVRFLLLIQCLGQPRAWSAFADSLLRDLLGIPPSLSPAVLADWQARLTPARLHALLETLECWQRDRGAVTGEIQILARSPARGEPVAVLLDGARGIWLSVYSYPPHRLEKLLVPLRQRLAGAGEESAVLVSHADFLAVLRREFPERKIIGFDQAAMAEAEPELMGIMARLPKLPAELAYLSLPRTFPLARPWRRALTVAAQSVLRNFAWRLPGFAGSNLPYLYSNFLDFTASLEDEPGRRVVRLGRPPLHLILNMTGMLRNSYRLSWLDDRPFALFPEA